MSWHRHTYEFRSLFGKVYNEDGSEIPQPMAYCSICKRKPADGELLARDRIVGFYYLATPYSKYHLGLHAAYEMACEQRALFVKARIPCFSPIVHSHNVALYGDIDPLSHEIWFADDAPFMALAKALVVVKAPGWAESYGIGQEILAFQTAGKPVYHMDLGEIPEAILREVR